MSKPQESETARIFIAVTLPSSLQHELARARLRFLDCDSVLKWVAPDALHLTMRFLGDVAISRLESVQRAALQGSDSIKAFAARVHQIGAYPNPRAPQTIWTGIHADRGHEMLTRLFLQLDNALFESGFARETRAFAPHVTLARVRNRATSSDKRCVATALAAARTIEFQDDTFQVDGLSIMQSELNDTGPTYTTLYRAKLAPSSH